MRNSEHRRGSAGPFAAAIASLALLTAAVSAQAEAQEAARGFALERFYPSAPGGGWLVMDDLAVHGGLGGAFSISSGYAHDPLQVPVGPRTLAVVSGQAFADVGVAVTFDRYRLYVNFDMPLTVTGQSGVSYNSALTAPSVGLASNPDSLSDPRIGFDARLFGEAGSRFRAGLGAQLIVPSGLPSDYVTDGTYRGMVRVLFAGQEGIFTYAGQLGVHLRGRDDSLSLEGRAWGSTGPELLFGIAGGPRVWRDRAGHTKLVVGPEIYGESAFRSLLQTSQTGLEALVTGRLERDAEDGPGWRVKLGAGGGLDAHFGAPTWRTVVALELTDARVDRDDDGIPDRDDACPAQAGRKDTDRRRNGCPETGTADAEVSP